MPGSWHGGGDALLGVPCVACLATMTAALSASAWVCLDDPCELCMSDACGESDLGSDPPTFCVEGIASPDPETGSTAGRYWLEQRYRCVGITTSPEWWLFGDEVPEYRGTQCVQSGDIRPGERCKYGCASPAPNEPVSRTCKPAPLVCDPASCTAPRSMRTPRPAPSRRRDLRRHAAGRGPGGASPRRTRMSRCAGSPGGRPRLSVRRLGCADATSCKCPAGQARGEPWCLRAWSASPYEVIQQGSRYEWIDATSNAWSRPTVPHRLCAARPAARTTGSRAGPSRRRPRPQPRPQPRRRPRSVSPTTASARNSSPRATTGAGLATVTQPTASTPAAPSRGDL